MLQNNAFSYVVDLKKLDEKVNNVKDFQFLHGYCEPTILLLFEPLRTWPGRVAVRKVRCVFLVSLEKGVGYQVGTHRAGGCVLLNF